MSTKQFKYDIIIKLIPLWLANETRKRRARSPKFAYLIHQKRSDCSHTIVHSKYTVQLHTQYIPSTQRKSLCIEWCRKSGRRLDSSAVARKPSLKGLEWHSIIYIWCKNGPSGNIAAAPTNVLLSRAVGPGETLDAGGAIAPPPFFVIYVGNIWFNEFQSKHSTVLLMCLLFNFWMVFLT